MEDRQRVKRSSIVLACLPSMHQYAFVPVMPSCPVFVLSLDLLRLRLRERFRRREVLRARFSGLRSRLVVSSVSNSARPVLHACLSHESKFPNC